MFIKMRIRLVALLFTVLQISYSSANNSFSEAISNALYISYQTLKCPFGNCCNDYWIPNDISKLKRLLKEEVFGQHIASELIARQIEAHITNPSPSKPLVMSFHGWTGNGKNHVAYLIAKSLYKSEVKSPFYHHFMSTAHFPHSDHVRDYQDQIRSWVKGNVSSCPHSLFVFDEIDKMPLGVMDGIKPYLDYVERVDNIDFRRSIFIFLSNTGGKEITKVTLQAWQGGQRNREDLTIRDFERIIELGAFNEMGGLRQSYLIEKSLIDLYVPFLPMEKRHVRMCVENEFKKQNYLPMDKDKALQRIVEELNYDPENLGLYSRTGCKRVAQKVSSLITEEKYARLLKQEL